MTRLTKAGATGLLARPSLTYMASALLFCSLLPANEAPAADVFVSYSAEGLPRYASHRVDASYRMFIRGEADRQARQPATKPASEGYRRGKRQLAPLIEHYARIHDVSPQLVTAVVGVESGFNSQAVSSKGAIGAMQLMPATAARYGVTDPADTAQNIDAGVRHLKGLLVRHQGNVVLALSAYNAGQDAVARYGGSIPPYRETMLYVPAVLAAAARGSRP